MIEEGVAPTVKKRVEIYPLSIIIVKSNEDGSLDPKSEIEIQISKKATVEEVCLVHFLRNESS